MKSLQLISTFQFVGSTLQRSEQRTSPILTPTLQGVHQQVARAGIQTRSLPLALQWQLDVSQSSRPGLRSAWVAL